MSVLLDALSRPAPIVLVPTGMVPTRSSSPQTPLQVAEIVREVRDAVGLGITAVHLHARDADDQPTWRREVYAELITGIREFAPELVINVSTSGRNWADLEKRADVLFLDGDAKPDLASLTLSSLNFAGGPSVNSLQTVRDLARTMQERGIVPELEVFDLGMLNVARVLRREGLLDGVVPLNLFFGNIAGMQPTPTEFAAALAALPDDVLWSATGLGDYQGVTQAMAVHAGGGVRVGLEDGQFLDRARTIPATNLMLLERVHRYLELAERRMMSAEEFRAVVKPS